MAPKSIVAKFADALEKFELTNCQLSDTNLTQIREVLATLLLQIPHDEMEVTHNLIVLIWPVVAYTTRYGADFSKPARVGAYNGTIDDDATAVVCARTEAVHTDKCADRGTYKMARRKTAQFILAVNKDTWVQKLRDPETFYTDVAPKALLSHVQEGCTGHHALDLLSLHNKMQRY